MLVRIFVFLLFNLAVISVSAQGTPQADIEVKADKTSGLTGETYTLNFVVSGAAIEGISWELIDKLFPDDILLKKSSPKVSESSGDQFKRQIIFTSADSGHISIGPFPVIVRYLHQTDTINARQVNFYFKQQPIESSINEIMPVNSVMSGIILQSNLFKSFAAVIFLLLGIIGLVMIRRRGTQGDSLLDARKRALEGLDFIESRRTGTGSNPSESREEAARIFRGYLKYVHAEKDSSSFGLTPEEEWLKKLLKNDDEARFGIREQDDLSFQKHVQELKEFIILYPRPHMDLKSGK